MPGAILSPYKQVPETKADLDWAELVTLDLSLFDTPEGKQELAKQLTYAAQHVGFFYVKNFNISQEEVDRQFALGREFYDLPLEEKLKYHNLEDLHNGEYNGYRPAGLRQLTETVVDNVQVYNLPKFDGYHQRAQPPVLQNHIKEIENFSRKCHSEVVKKLLRLFAIILELPDEDQLVKDHEYDVKGEDHLRYMHYAARSPELNAQVGELYSPGHTDLGSITLLFRQPVAALQILNSEQQWKWVKPQDETITINICDALQALTGNFLKSSIHRVHTPPDDQAHIDRLGVLFFARPNNHVVLNPITNSPLLNRLGLKDNDLTKLGQHLTMEQWVKARQSQQQRRTKAPKIDGQKYQYGERDMEIIPGLLAKGIYAYGDFYYGPAVDGVTIRDYTQREIEAGRFSKVALMIDHSSFEGVSFTNFSTSSWDETVDNLKLLWPEAGSAFFDRLKQVYPLSDFSGAYFNETFFSSPILSFLDSSLNLSLRTNSEYWRAQQIYGDYIINRPTYYQASAFSEHDLPVYKLIFNAGSELHGAPQAFFGSAPSETTEPDLARAMVGRPVWPQHSGGNETDFRILDVYPTSFKVRSDLDANAKCDFLYGRSRVVYN